jgi:protein SCO1/2
MPRPAPRLPGALLRPLDPACRQCLFSTPPPTMAMRSHLRRPLTPPPPLSPRLRVHAPSRALHSTAPLPKSSDKHHSSAKKIKVENMVDLMRRHTGTGPFSIIGIGLFVVTGIALFFYFDHEKARLQRKRVADENKSIGRPKVGGAFDLIDHSGQPFDHSRLLGRFSLVYFGFTRCPDICPDELDKMARMLDLVAEGAPRAAVAADPRDKGLVPVFITCDPARDPPHVLKAYLAEFHPRIVGLTGTYDDIKAVCKAYRVYFSTPEHVAPGKDYLVDHSIYFYLMGPDGQFVEALGRQHSPEEGARLILRHMRDWDGKWEVHDK